MSAQFMKIKTLALGNVVNFKIEEKNSFQKKDIEK